MLERAISHLADLVGFASVSAVSNAPAASHVATFLGAQGARVRASDAGGKVNLWATIGPEAPGGLVLSGHLDVVPVEGQNWTHPPFELTRTQGRLYGRGSCDMLGFVACVLAMVPDLVARPLARPVHIALTHDEEVGCLGAQRLVAELAARGAAPALCLVGEPTQLRVVEAHKGCNEYTTRFVGLAGHGSAPGRAVNAALFAARHVCGLQQIAAGLRGADTPFDPPETTISIGAIHGGSAHNVIPERAEVQWELREARPGDAADVLARVTALEAALQAEMQALHPGAAVTRTVIGEVAGLMPQTPHPMRDLMLALTGENRALSVPFGTEAGLFQGLGAATVVCGPGDIAQAHTADEFITETQMAACLDLLARLFSRLR